MLEVIGLEGDRVRSKAARTVGIAPGHGGAGGLAEQFNGAARARSFQRRRK